MWRDFLLTHSLKGLHVQTLRDNLKQKCEETFY